MISASYKLNEQSAKFCISNEFHSETTQQEVKMMQSVQMGVFLDWFVLGTLEGISGFNFFI